MNIFELLFLAFVITTLFVLPVAFVQRKRKRGGSGRILRGIALFWAIYLALVVLVSAFKPQRLIPFGQDRCLDDMCFAVQNVETFGRIGLPSEPLNAQGTFYVVTIRVTNRSLGRTMSERGIRAVLTDEGKTFEVSPQGQRAWESTRTNSALTKQLAAGESVASTQVFDLPQSATDPKLLLTHGWTPGYLVIGESPIVHEPALQLLTR